MKKRIKIFDTTLRDGEQCPGASLNMEEKQEVARQLAKLGVDIIEAGFAVASPGDFEAIRRIAAEVQGPIICSLSRAKELDIQRAADAIAPASRKRIHTFLATSPIHMEYKLRMKPNEVLKQSVAMVKFAKSLCDDVEFSPEDAGRSEKSFLYEVIAAVIEAGANVVNIPDTVGYTIPEEFGGLIKSIFKNVKVPKHVDISVHCHNDLGMAVANSLAAVKNGATQVECTINGIGERAGNASLEEIVMAIKTRQDFFDCETGVNTKEIYKSSRLVSHLTGMLVQPNKAIVGGNAFAHESGIHQHGMMRFQQTYEIMKPEEIGLTASLMVIGKHSGRHAFVQKLKDLGFDLNTEEIDAAFAKFKDLADKKKEVSNRDIEALVADQTSDIPETFKLESVHVTSGTDTRPQAKVRILREGKSVETEETGDGPVDAVFKCIAKLTQTESTLVDYIIQAITGGTDALGEVAIRIEKDGEIFSGHGSHTDIIVSSAKAYVNALNKLAGASADGAKRLKPTESELTP